MKTLNAIISAAIFFGAATFTATAFAADEYNVSTGTTVEGHGVALRGNDPVALSFGLGVVAGKAAHTFVHDGVAYYFASEETMKQFSAAPEMFMPQYGGFCALGVALGKKLDGSPRFADIVNRKLYLFLNAAVFEAYLKDKEGTLAKAAETWPSIRDRAVRDVNS